LCCAARLIVLYRNENSARRDTIASVVKCGDKKNRHRSIVESKA
jgi:hypothetical protein